jgi:hypothetical protein
LSTGAAAPVGAGAGVEAAGADDTGLAGAGADLFEFDAAGFDEGDFDEDDFDEDDFDVAGFEEPDGPLAGTLTTAWHWGHLIRLPAALSGTRRRRLQLEQTTSIGMTGDPAAIHESWQAATTSRRGVRYIVACRLGVFYMVAIRSGLAPESAPGSLIVSPTSGRHNSLAMENGRAT